MTFCFANSTFKKEMTKTSWCSISFIRPLMNYITDDKTLVFQFNLHILDRIMVSDLIYIYISPIKVCLPILVPSIIELVVTYTL
jgi:hypothetical protein